MTAVTLDVNWFVDRSRIDRRYHIANWCNPTGALPLAPPAGAWFPESFRQLMTNAYPPLP